MNRKGIVTAFLLAAGLLAGREVRAQRTYEEMEQLTVNERVTTVVTASEPVRLVDISTDKVAGDQPLDNIVRLKPKEAGHEDGEVLAIVTIVTERYRTQYALVYTTRMREAVTDKEILPREREAYNNPAVSMSTAEMTRYARRIWNSPAKIRNVATKAHRMTMRLNNIYAVGDYFFIDFSIDNQHPLRHRRDANKARGQETGQGDQRTDHRAGPGPDTGERQDVPTRLPQRGRREENDLPQRQDTDSRNDGEAD